MICGNCSAGDHWECTNRHSMKIEESGPQRRLLEAIYGVEEVDKLTECCCSEEYTRKAPSK